MPLYERAMKDPQSSIDLLVKAQQGDEDALNQLLERYRPRLSAWARGRLPLGLRSMLDTQDLVQDAIINALRSLDSLEIRDERSLEHYLRRIVNNRIIDLYRRKARRPQRVELPEDAAADDIGPQEAAIAAEDRELYELALAQLPEDDRSAIVLSLELGFDYSEIAEELHKPSADSARMMVKRARQKLAHIIAEARR